MGKLKDRGLFLPFRQEAPSPESSVYVGSESPSLPHGRRSTEVSLAVNVLSARMGSKKDFLALNNIHTARSSKTSKYLRDGS